MPRMELLPHLIAADLPHGRVPSRVARPHILKAVLLVVWYYEGCQITVAGVAARAGMENSTAACALSMLRKLGFIVNNRDTRAGTMAYLIVADKLKSCPTDEPLYRRKGDRDRYDQEQRAFART
jgi:hypothetical protein